MHYEVCENARALEIFQTRFKLVLLFEMFKNKPNSFTY